MVGLRWIALGVLLLAGPLAGCAAVSRTEPAPNPVPAASKDEPVAFLTGLFEEGYEYDASVTDLLSADESDAAGASPLVDDTFDVEEALGEAPATADQLPLPQGVTYGVPVVRNAEVLKMLEYFTTTKREVIEAALGRSSHYVPLMTRILREEGVPTDLVWLCLIESAFKKKAYSYAGASGLWQFIRGTGRLYGLQINWWLDERRDVERATRAAARYLKDLYTEFKAWPLALAAYNAGEGRVRRAIRRGGTSNFWELSARRLLPRQTRNYVPAFMAGLIIAKQPELFGFTPSYLPPFKADRVEFNESVDLEVVARCAGVSLREVRELNPHFRRVATPSGGRPYGLYLPAGTSSRFAVEIAKVPDSEKITWRYHRLRRGQTLSYVARRYGTTVRALMDINGIRNPRRVRAGTLLTVPAPGLSKASIRRHSRRVAAKSSSSTAKARRIHRVRRGENLYKIARRYGVTVAQLQRWNKIGRRALIHPGDRLVVYSSR